MNRAIVAFTWLTFLALPAFSGHASEAPFLLSEQITSSASLASLIQEALEHNPRLKAARFRVEAAKARTALFRNIPDPMLEFEYDKILPAASMNGSGNERPMRSLAVSQEIPFPTKIYMRKRSAQKEAYALEQDYREVERAIIKEVKESYAGLYLSQRKVDYSKDLLNLMDQFVEVTNKKYSVNKAGRQDVLRAQIEYSKLSNSVILYEKEAIISQNLLRFLLGRDGEELINLARVDPVSSLDLKEEDIIVWAKKNRPDLKSLKAMLERADLESSLSKHELIPDITLKYKREEKDGKLSGIGQGEWSGSVGVNVPLWFWGKQVPAIREAKANLEAAKADYVSAENMAVFEVKSSYARYEAARRLVEMYETGILPQADSAVVTAQRGYESGSLSFLELLDALKMSRDLQMEYFESVAELEVSLADLERSVGGDLEQRGNL